MFSIQVWDRRERFNPDVEEYQADISLPNGNDYHSIGSTPQEALMRLANYWAGREGAPAPQLEQTQSEDRQDG